MTRLKKLSIGDFVFTKEKVHNINKRSVGIVKETQDDQISIFFIGIDETIKLDKNKINYLDIDRTGKNYNCKICNICHILKDTNKFEINQTDARGRKTTRPSCKECRKFIDGMKLSSVEKNKLDKIAPKRKSLFTCPICKKRTIVGINANLVRDHDHKTGKARAWICDSCNTGLGRFKDDIHLLEEAIAYLKGYR